MAKLLIINLCASVCMTKLGKYTVTQQVVILRFIFDYTLVWKVVTEF